MNLGEIAAAFRTQLSAGLSPATPVILKFMNFDLRSAEMGIMVGKAFIFGDTAALTQLLSPRGVGSTFCNHVGMVVKDFIPDV